MFNIITTILITAILSIGIQNYVPLKYFELLNFNKQTFGTTLTTINSTDTISGSRTTINNNFTALNNGKIENATTSVASITTLAGLTSASSLATVGTITSGVWNATALSVAKGGTGTTSPSTWLVMLGNGSGGLTTASTTGTSGQFLTSNGAGFYPSWQSASVDQTANYTWTGMHNFSLLFATQASSTNATTTNLTVTGNTIGIAKIASSTTFKTAGTFTWANLSSVTSVEVIIYSCP